MNHDKVVRGLDGKSNRREEMYQDSMRLRNSKYGFFKIGEAVPDVICSVCKTKLNGTYTSINKAPYCNNCMANLGK